MQAEITDTHTSRASMTTFVVAAAVLAASLFFAASPGCGQPPPADAEATAGAVGQDLVSAQVCLNGATRIYRPGAAGTVYDAQIAAVTPPKAYGGSNTFNTGVHNGIERRTLLQFDLSAIPSGPDTNIQGADLFLTEGNVLPTAQRALQLHRVTAPLWTLAPYGEGAITWESFAAGGSFDPAPAAFLDNSTNPSSKLLQTSITQLVADWVHGVTPNHGILLMDPGGPLTNFWSSEYSGLWSRPYLAVCYTITCQAGWADCNANGLDGCEADLAGSVAHCGACGDACSVQNGVPACVNGTCQVASCNLGFGDCNGGFADGCETLLTTNQSCGACGVPCSLPNATASCATGTCTLTACGAGFHDCDGDLQNGCEATPCPDGSRCADDAGCAGGVCQDGFCAAPCADGLQGGAETGVDCGGPTCPKCPVGQPCLSGADCLSGTCAGGVCVDVSCDDALKNGAETDVDCGGAACASCPPGDGCMVDADCDTGVCTAGVCQQAVCNDGVKNGAETAVDCGGGGCPTCAAGKACLIADDCLDGACLNGVCQLASCSDTVKNGAETGVDCGGGSCPPCGEGQPCNTDADCDSAAGQCVGGACQATCGHGIVTGGGTITCGIGACQVTVQNCVEGQVQTCVPEAPSQELCDGIDNDCDGLTDDVCVCVDGKTQSCYTGAPATLDVGVCHAGTQTCAHGAWGNCLSEVTPNVELCDGLDNDCDGQVDEDLGQTTCGMGACTVTTPSCLNGVPQACVPRPPTQELCNGVDDDCDGVPDNPPDLTCGEGACQNSVPACVNGLDNTCAPSAPSAEQCDGVDNDCDGQVDDGLGAVTCGVGQCASSVPACVNGQANACVPGTPQAETCDGLDDDCDGVVDDGDPGGGAGCTTGLPGACAAGTTTCVAGALACSQAVQPAAEVCGDGVDDDCNGLVDDGCGTPAGCTGDAQCPSGACVGGVCAPSCGAGSFCPTSSTTVCGTQSYAAVYIPAGVTLTCAPGCTQPVVWNVGGDVLIAGTINLNGANGSAGTATYQSQSGGVGGLGGVGACGGSSGGRGGNSTTGSGSQGLGLGGGGYGTALADGVYVNGGNGSGGGFGTVGVVGWDGGAGKTGHSTAPGGTWSDAQLSTFLGGSGGGGGSGGLGGMSTGYGGYGGGAGGGALKIVASGWLGIAATGAIRANGGIGGTQDLGAQGAGGAGSGGAIRLSAFSVTNLGVVQAKGGVNDVLNGAPANAGQGGDGRIRIDDAGGATPSGTFQPSVGYTGDLCGLPCDTGLLGACAAGTTSCAHGALVTCVQDLQPTAETCDGVDNDCDGVADDGDPGAGVGCTTGISGICSPGTTACSGGHLVCNQDLPPHAETCDGLDEDCDGVVDDGDPGGGGACATGLLGTCAAGTFRCSGGAMVCQQDTQPSAELCDGLDNNCDGVADEGNPGGGLACTTGLSGVCAAGTTACASPALACTQDVPSSDEVCDGLDNDCDGVIDDGACVTLAFAQGTTFGNVGTGGSATLTATLGNPSGNPPVTLDAIGAGSVTGAGFSFVSTTCGATLAGGATCDVVVQFAPSGVGATNGTLSVGGTVGAQPVNPAGATLTGTGVSLSLSPAPYSYGNVDVAATSNQTFTLSNAAGGAQVSLTAPSVTGTGFSLVSTTCGTTLAAGSSCDVVVQFAPATAGNASGTLGVSATNLTPAAYTSSLSGTGVSTTVVTCSSGSQCPSGTCTGGVCAPTCGSGSWCPSSSTTLTCGTQSYTTVYIPAGVTITCPTGCTQAAVWNVSGPVVVAGTINLNGKDGSPGSATTSGTASGGLGGVGLCGGSAGGKGGTGSTSGTMAGSNGVGTGRGGYGTARQSGIYYNGGNGGGAGYGTVGFVGWDGGTGKTGSPGAAGVTWGSASLSTFLGGSGGGGGSGGLGGASTRYGGYGGGAGGGALHISASGTTGYIAIGSAGRVTANGGIGGTQNLGARGAGGAGSGGAIRLSAATITNLGAVYAKGGDDGAMNGAGATNGDGGFGRIRADTTGAVTPSGTWSPAIGYTGSY